MGTGFILLNIFISAAILWILVRVFANEEGDLSPTRYPLFGACYWFVTWMGVTALQWGIWTLVPLVVFTIFALCQFFYLTLEKSFQLGMAFVVLRSLMDLGMAIGRV